MRKLLLFFTVTAAAMTAGCSKYIEYACRINYIYENKCSSEITVHVVQFFPEETDSLFVIPVYRQHTITLTGEGGYPLPFRWAGSPNRESVTISNGERIVTQTRLDSEGLYVIENYTPISEVKCVKTVSFVFTDDFFENGEPIE